MLRMPRTRHAPIPLSDAELTRWCIDQFGLSDYAFARQIVWREDRQVRRWVNGYSPLSRRYRQVFEDFYRWVNASPRAAPAPGSMAARWSDFASVG